MDQFGHDPVTDEAAYLEMSRFFTDVRRQMKNKGQSSFHIATQMRLSKTTLDHYFDGMAKGRRFRISEETVRRLANWAELDPSTYRFARVPRGGLKRREMLSH